MYEYSSWGIDSVRNPIGVVDGDTMHVGVDLGMDVAMLQSIRVYGINAPELSTVAGKEAKIWAIEWFKTNCPANKFTIQTVKDKREKYGRYLATIVAPNGRIFNLDIVDEGIAVEYYP